jgi:hypothetical protein
VAVLQLVEPPDMLVPQTLEDFWVAFHPDVRQSDSDIDDGLVCFVSRQVATSGLWGVGDELGELAERLCALTLVVNLSVVVCLWVRVRRWLVEESPTCVVFVPLWPREQRLTS